LAGAVRPTTLSGGNAIVTVRDPDAIKVGFMDIGRGAGGAS